MHELASVHQHENGYSVTLRKPKSDGKKYEYDSGKSHVAADHNEAAAIVHSHLKGISDNQAKASKDKADKMDNAARKAYRALTGVDSEGEDNRKDAHRNNTLRKGGEKNDAYNDDGKNGSRDTKTSTRDYTDEINDGQ